MLYFLDKNFWYHLELIALFVTTLALVIFARYLAISVLYQFLLNILRTKSARHMPRNTTNVRSEQIKREIKWAFTASGIFAGLVALGLLAYQHGFTMIYTNINAYSLVYFFAAPVILLALYETYYYWLHRWMHRPGVFNRIHKVHHESISPTVFTAFSFHPVEALLQFIFFPVIILFIPIHAGMLAAVFLVLSFFAVVNHAGTEIYSGSIRKFLIGSAHHEAHHQRFRVNFGLNFTWWDAFMKTENKPDA